MSLDSDDKSLGINYCRIGIADIGVLGMQGRSRLIRRWPMETTTFLAHHKGDPTGSW